MKPLPEDRPQKADCGHVADPLEIVVLEGRALCPECAAYHDELED